MHRPGNNNKSDTKKRSTLRIFFLICIGSVLAGMISCNTGKNNYRGIYRRMNVQERKEADSLLAYALDHEALYSLADTLKPVSSVKLFRLPLLSNEKEQRDSARHALEGLQKMASKMSSRDWMFVVNPFERADSIYKLVEVYVVRKSRLSRQIATYSAFYDSLGLTPQSHPATVLAVTEQASRYQRWRSYGYLFGYPGYAVDFFVTAGMSQDSTGVFVKRDFFQIPVYAGTRGYFTYAVPAGYLPGMLDSSLYYNATQTLKMYSGARNRFVTAGRGLKAVRLLHQLTK